MNFPDFKGTIYDFFGYFSPGALLITVYSITFFHSKNINNIYPIILGHIKSPNIFEVLLFAFVSYIIGHAVASISSFFIEKVIFKKISYINNKLLVKNLLTADLYSFFTQKFKERFESNFNDNNDFRAIICYVQKNNASIYDTAFTFLSFYGMARNFTFIFFSAFLLEVYNFIALHLNNSVVFIITYFIFTIVFSYEYFRFKKYHKEQLINGFLL